MADISTIQDYALLNKEVRNWSKQTENVLRNRLAYMGIEDTGKLMQGISTKFRSSSGHISKIGIGFQRYGVFVAKGAGRGMGGREGSKWYDAQGKMKQTNPASLGKMGTGSRRDRDWFNPVIETRIDLLADIIVANYKDLIIDKVKTVERSKIN